MIKHVVCWKLYEQALEGDKQTNARMIKERLEKLDEALPMMQSTEVGINAEKAPGDNYDVVLICVFDSVQTLNDYKVHPEHQAFVEFVTPLAEDVVNVDFEAD
jgi:antibiotic biosynthesis monooxygenase (ABM) superfamily enzyme